MNPSFKYYHTDECGEDAYVCHVLDVMNQILYVRYKWNNRFIDYLSDYKVEDLGNERIFREIPLHEFVLMYGVLPGEINCFSRVHT